MSTQILQPKTQWKPVRHSVLRDPETAATLLREGLMVRPFLAPEQVEALQEVYRRHHDIPDGEGGMFYSLYSQDLEYRGQVHDEIQEVLRPSLDAWLQDYKNPINSFVVKKPGPGSEFEIHQDMTALDESRYSALSIWLPLCDVTPDNGAMCFVRRSHDMFHPYRGSSWPQPFDAISGVVRRYLEPVHLRAGEAILFDQRILHTSLPNRSDRDRPAIVCGIFPAEATFRTCFRESPDGPIELWSQDEDFLLRYPNFFHYCTSRPVTGNRIGYADRPCPPVTAEAFEAMCRERGLEPADAMPPRSAEETRYIAEPVDVVRPPLAPVA